MRRIVFSIVLAVFVTAGYAQTAASSFDVGGIKVIYKPTVKQIVSVDLYFRGGLNNYPAAQAGIENLTLAATAECGTKKYTKNAFKDKEDAYGISVSGSSGYDFGVISLNCISKYFNEGWDLFAEAVVHPTFDERELGLLKTKLITGLSQSESDPDTRIEQMAMQNTFAGTIYGLQPSGTEATISKFHQAELAKYYTALLNKNRMFIVVAGKISKEEITAKIKAAFSAIPAKPYVAPAYKVPVIAGNKVFPEDRILATNYIQGVMNAPSMSSPDYAGFRLAFSAFDNHLFSEIRTKRNLSYAPSAGVKVLKMPFSTVYVSTTDPAAAVEVMVNELNELRAEGFSEEDFLGAKSGFITTNYMKQESTAAIAASLGLAEIMGGWKLAEELPEKLNNTTLEQMNAAFRKYTAGIVWNYLGLKKQADAASGMFAMPIK
ncbi:M16 family metallopeptidase [Hufsiella ginkgonis]|uniref:Insulinase family protein n=1 Tax=Hufsiella ginkgonis TaxID=2695274 RepID=A0A7K1Y3Y8_9SPHI|nr:pitrilysin family protein [Hufsiella ginkgonis]MXV17769.1 hypothetical protein [Hufsiella ginkgonis]